FQVLPVTRNAWSWPGVRPPGRYSRNCSAVITRPRSEIRHPPLVMDLEHRPRLMPRVSGGMFVRQMVVERGDLDPAGNQLRHCRVRFGIGQREVADAVDAVHIR